MKFRDMTIAQMLQAANWLRKNDVEDEEGRSCMALAKRVEQECARRQARLISHQLADDAAEEHF